MESFLLKTLDLPNKAVLDPIGLDGNEGVFAVARDPSSCSGCNQWQHLMLAFDVTYHFHVLYWTIKVTEKLQALK